MVWRPGRRGQRRERVLLLVPRTSKSRRKTRNCNSAQIFSSCAARRTNVPWWWVWACECLPLASFSFSPSSPSPPCEPREETTAFFTRNVTTEPPLLISHTIPTPPPHDQRFLGTSSSATDVCLGNSPAFQNSSRQAELWRPCLSYRRPYLEQYRLELEQHGLLESSYFFRKGS